MISASWLPDASTWPAVMVRNGPLTANSLSGSTPVATITVDLSPLLIRAAELHSGQHLAHGRVGEQLDAQGSDVVQAVLQRRVFVAHKLLGCAQNQVAGAARRGLGQCFVGRQRKATGQQNGGSP